MKGKEKVLVLFLIEISTHHIRQGNCQWLENKIERFYYVQSTTQNISRMIFQVRK
jgi:hypothetical protein